MLATGLVCSFCIVFAAVETGGVAVEIGESVVIAKSDDHRVWFPGLMPFDSTTVAVLIQRAADEINPEPIPSLRSVSKDAGRTWTEPAPLGEAGNSWTRLKDGSCLWLSYLLIYQSENAAGLRVGKSKDGVEYAWSDGLVDVSPNQFDKGPKGTASVVVHRSIVEGKAGELLATMYGRFAGDALDRSILVESADGGATWKYRSTIGYDPDIGGEGLNEPCMVRLADGDLFCFMRNGRKPLFSARSSDDGRTWSAPEGLPEQYQALTVDPCVIRLSDGALACSAGRPNCHLILNLDGTGKTWTGPFAIFTGPTTSYTSIYETSPGKLFYLHDVTPAGWKIPKKGQFHEVRGVFLTIKR